MKKILILIFLMIIIKASTISDEPKQERGNTEIKHSLQTPFLFGLQSTIPHWEFGGSTILTEHYIRLTPNIKSRVGWLWNSEVNFYL
jgi:lectin, mannose-binding 2